MAVLAVASLARPEGLFLLVLALFDRLLVFDREEGELVWRRPPLRPILVGIVFAALALIGPLLAYRWAGGSFLPTTFGAKGAGLRQMLPNLAYVHTVIGVFFRSQPILALLTGAGIVALIARLGTREDRGLLPALWVLGLPLAYSLMAPGPTKLMGNFGRYYFPLLPVVIVLGMLGLEPAARALKRRPLGALLAGLILATAVWGFTQGAMRYARNVANVEDSDVRIARWLGERVPPQALLAVNDIGAIKFLLPNPVLDLAGIANPEIRGEVARIQAGTGLPWQAAMAEAIARRRPDYVVVFPKWLPGLGEDPRFRPVHLLEVPDNITMGGDEIVVYATAWTRYPMRAVPE